MIDWYCLVYVERHGGFQQASNKIYVWNSIQFNNMDWTAVKLIAQNLFLVMMRFHMSFKMTKRWAKRIV